MKGHQTQGGRGKGKLEVASNHFYDSYTAEARKTQPQGGSDPFFPHQRIGISRDDERLHRSRREAIQMAARDKNMQDYICDKAGWATSVFESVDWMVLNKYIITLSAVKHTNAIKMVHN